MHNAHIITTTILVLPCLFVRKVAAPQRNPSLKTVVLGYAGWRQVHPYLRKLLVEERCEGAVMGS